MSTEQNKKTVQTLLTEGMNKRNYSIIDQVIAPGFVNHGIPNATKGPEGFKEIIRQFVDAFPDMNIHLEHIVAEGDQVATRGYWTGTNSGSFMGAPATGRKVRCEFVDFWTLQNGKCTENWVQMDMVGVMQQLELMPTPTLAHA
jgi:predicted ester cyclase